MTFADHSGDLPDAESSQSGSRYAAIFSKSPVHSSSAKSPFVWVVPLSREAPGADVSCERCGAVLSVGLLWGIYGRD